MLKHLFSSAALVLFASSLALAGQTAPTSTAPSTPTVRTERHSTATHDRTDKSRKHHAKKHHKHHKKTAASNLDPRTRS